MSDGIIDVLESMARNEEAVGRLYSIYAAKFKDYKGLWDSLVAEEIGHRDSINQFAKEARKGSLAIRGDRFDALQVSRLTGYINSLLDYAKKTEINIKDALFTAYDIENNLIEKDVFRAMEGDSGELKQLLLRLTSDTDGHRKKLEAECRKIGNGMFPS